MATGDHHYTALAVARGVGMVPPHGQIIIIEKDQDATPAYSSPGMKETDQMSGPSASKAVSAAAQPSSVKPGKERSIQLGSHSAPSTFSVTFAINQEHPDKRSQQRLPSVADTYQHRPDQPLSAVEHSLDAAPSFRRQQRMNGSEHQGLLFHPEHGNVAGDNALQALTAIAQVCLDPSSASYAPCNESGLSKSQDHPSQHHLDLCIHHNIVGVAARLLHFNCCTL